MGRRPRAVKPPKVAYTLLTRTTHPDLYARLDALITAHHEDLREARVALAWCTSWRADIDGHQQLGKCKKASALDRELADWDIVILLAQWYMTDPQTTPIQKDALLDHELCHATTKDDPLTGDPVLDARGRIVYRLRRHDVEEFACIPERYGLWKRDLETFARAMQLGASKQARLPIETPPAAVEARRTH